MYREGRKLWVASKLTLISIISHLSFIAHPKMNAKVKLTLHVTSFLSWAENFSFSNVLYCVPSCSPFYKLKESNLKQFFPFELVFIALCSALIGQFNRSHLNKSRFGYQKIKLLFLHRVHIALNNSNRKN